VSKQNQTNTCALRFEVTYPAGSYTCTQPLFHDNPHYDKYNAYVWGYVDQTKDPIYQQRKDAAVAKAAKRKLPWRRARRG